MHRGGAVLAGVDGIKGMAASGFGRKAFRDGRTFCSPRLRWRPLSHRIVSRVTAVLIAAACFPTVCLPAAAQATSTDAVSCGKTSFNGASYAWCEVDPAAIEVRLFLNNGRGAPFAHFSSLKKHLAARGARLVFAMNGGMYHQDRRPVGHYVEAGEETMRVNTNEGPGNFHLLPNGVFFVKGDGAGRRAGVMESARYLREAGDVQYATQSGPMLVIDGAPHPKFLPDSTSLKRRNGVGARADGVLVFAISDAGVTFHDFAEFFRKEMKTPNALYLDGTISRLYAPSLGRNDAGVAMGPIIAATTIAATTIAPAKREDAP